MIVVLNEGFEVKLEEITAYVIHPNKYLFVSRFIVKIYYVFFPIENLEVILVHAAI